MTCTSNICDGYVRHAKNLAEVSDFVVMSHSVEIKYENSFGVGLLYFCVMLQEPLSMREGIRGNQRATKLTEGKGWISVQKRSQYLPSLLMCL